MPRPKDEKGLPLPPAHKRLDMAPFHKAALFAIASDPRASALPVGRKLALIDRAVDYIIDGDKAPKWVFARDHDRPANTFLVDMWRLAVREVSRVPRSDAHV